MIFFLGKNLEIFSDSNLFFRRLNFDFFSNSVLVPREKEDKLCKSLQRV